MHTATIPKSGKSSWLTFWPLWVLANVVGWSLAEVIALLSLPDLGTMIVVALVISVLQWLCLRFFLHADYLWIPVSIITYAGALWAAFLLPSYFLFVSLVFLVLLSGLQYFALSYYVDHAITWVIVSPLAIIIAVVILFVLEVATRFTIEPSVLFQVIVGAIYGALTGALLIVLKTSTKPKIWL